MDNNDVQLIGGPCGQHGPYTFYKAFKYTKNGVKRIVTLSEFFFVKLWIDSDLLCIGELQLLWIDKNSEQVLASLRLYFLPENTPEGRMDHGEDEVLAIAEKVVIRVEDLITWITIDAEWSWGRLAKCESEMKPTKLIEEPLNALMPVSLTESSLDFSDVDKERKSNDISSEKCGPSVLILSYPRYCRYRAMMKRLENVEDDYLKLKIVNALGGFSVISKNTRILFCRDTFDYPELEGHELLCNHLAPKLKGRPRGKRKKRSVSPGSESNESESSVSTYTRKITTEGGRNGLRCDTTTSPRRSTRAVENTESKLFIKKLNSFMKANHTPIGRVPSLGYKELDLHDFFSKVQKLGGYDCVTTNRLWKSIFDDLSGHQSSTSAATVIRRHYERFLLPYERHIKGEEYKPLPGSERRRLKSKASGSASEAENSEETSNSGASTPVPTCSGYAIPSTSKDFKDVPTQNKSECKTSSLRSVRVKPERQKEKLSDKTQIQNNNNSNNNLNETETVNTEIEPDDVKPKIEKLIIKSESGIIIKTENTDAVDVKVEASIKTECIKIEKVEAIEKDVEPLTSAVAPVVQKISPDNSLSPIEGKENVPIIQTGDTGTSGAGAEIIEVPFKPKTPEIVDLESETFKSMNTNNINKTFMQEVKKRKLDILKEGGLEVTPVKSSASITITKESRPSVIQPALSTSTKAQTNNDMPPPSINIVPTKRLNISVSSHLINVNQSKVSNQKSPIKSSSPIKAYPINNGSPPKVLQSKSIYSYSEKTVYGNPKDVLFTPNANYAPVPPKFGNRTSDNGDILDLTVTSPQKPRIEMMRMTQIPPNSVYNRLSDTKVNHPSPLIDGRRLGSNLEITLVGPNNNKPPIPSNHHHHNHHKYNNISSSIQITPHVSSRYQPHRHKRMSNEIYYNSKIPRTEESKYTSKPNTSLLPVRDPKSGLEISIPNPYVNKSPSIKADPINNHIKSMQPQKPYPNSSVPSFPGYLSQFYESAKPYPYQPSLLDFPYLSTMQSMYANNAMTAPSMLMPTQDQLKLYAELLSQSRLPFTFPVPQETNPNNFKKQ